MNGEDKLESKLRLKNQLTIPGEVVELLHLKKGDFVRFEINGGSVNICKAVTSKVNNNCGGGKDGSNNQP